MNINQKEIFSQDNVIGSFFTITITMVNNNVLRYSTLDKEIELYNNLYKPCLDIDDISSAIMSSSDNGIKVRIYDDISIYNISSSRIEISINNTSLNEISHPIYNGLIGSSLCENGISYEIQILPLFYSLNKSIGDFFSPLCRASLGDKKCKKDLKSFTFDGVIMSILSNRMFIGNHRKQESGYFFNGIITFHDGTKSQIEEESDCIVTLVSELAKNIKIGMKYSITAGCDKTLSTCKSRFCNVINFRGEPFIL